MVVYEHYAYCEVVKLSDFTDEYDTDDDGELSLEFVINQRDVHHKDGEILNDLSEDITRDFTVDMQKLINDEVLEQALEQNCLITDLKHLVDLDILQEFVRDMLIHIGHTLLDTNYLFLDNSVERLQKDLSVQIYKLFKTDGATATNILVRIDVVNMHCYENIVEYHTSTLLRAMARAMAIVLHNEHVNEYEDEVLQLVQSASMEMEQPRELIGASSASIDALEKVKYKPEDCNEGTCCSVCFEEFMIEEEIRKMPCSSAHIFHTDCIEKWLKINHICPVCRYQMPTE